MDQLKTLFNSPIVHNFILEADYALYQYLVDILLPKVLKPIPNTLTQWIRTFSKNLESWMISALENVPEELKAIKVSFYKKLLDIGKENSTPTISNQLIVKIALLIHELIILLSLRKCILLCLFV